MKQFGQWRAEQLAVMLEGGCGGQLKLLPKPLLGLGAQILLDLSLQRETWALSMTAFPKDSTVSRA